MIILILAMLVPFGMVCFLSEYTIPPEKTSFGFPCPQMRITYQILQCNRANTKNKHSAQSRQIANSFSNHQVTAVACLLYSPNIAWILEVSSPQPPLVFNYTILTYDINCFHRMSIFPGDE